MDPLGSVSLLLLLLLFGPCDQFARPLVQVGGDNPIRRHVEAESRRRLNGRDLSRPLERDHRTLHDLTGQCLIQSVRTQQGVSQVATLVFDS